MPTSEDHKLKLIAQAYCEQYKTEATFYIEPAKPPALRRLVVLYADTQHMPYSTSEFAAGIPDDWTVDYVIENFLLWPMEHPEAPYPRWEVPLRAYGSPMLFSFWKKPDAAA
jgi:hypothetical protein